MILKEKRDVFRGNHTALPAGILIKYFSILTLEPARNSTKQRRTVSHFWGFNRETKQMGHYKRHYSLPFRKSGNMETDDHAKPKEPEDGIKTEK